ncbi:hypothetical protein [Streptomyces sp. NBC_01320]|uniref:hypothetical protein n=1 Tax=Streptomyces sp. NBC_01320 TaxID=2903824 RepID=UPI003FA3C8E6
MSTPSQQREFGATMEAGRFLTIGESDHWAVLERPDDAADLVARFCTDHLPRTAPVLAVLQPRQRAEHGAAIT